MTRQTETVRWVVVRQDVHGSRFDVTSFPTEAEAIARVDDFESGYPHHQTYFVERRGEDDRSVRDGSDESGEG